MQNRTGAITLILLLTAWWLQGQSCPVVTNTTVQILPIGVNQVCPGGKVRISTLATNISLDHYLEIYSGSNANFDPLNHEGSLLETIHFGDPTCSQLNCPTFIGAMINSCGSGSEAANEYMMFSSGGGMKVADLSVDFDSNNNNCPVDCADIGGGCSIVNPGLTLPGCANVYNAGPGDVIPPNSIVILFTSADANPSGYNWSALCGVSTMFNMPIYLLKSSCTRSFGAFTDQPGTEIRTYKVSFCNGCSDQINYSGTWPLDGSFATPGGQPQFLNCLAYPNVSPQTLRFDVTLDNAQCGTSNKVYFKLLWKNNSGCQLISTPNGNPAFALDCPSISILGDSTYCTGSQITLTGEGPFSTWKWKSGSFQRSTKSVQLNNQAGIFTLTGTTNNSCTATASINISQIPLPGNKLQYLPNDTICSGEIVSIQAPMADTYSWSTGSTSQNINPVVSDDLNFTVTLTNGGKCTSEIAGQVTADRSPACLAPLVTCPQPTFTTFNDTFCLSDVLSKPLLLDLPIPAGDSIKFYWHGPGIIDSTNNFNAYLTGGGTFIDTVEITMNDSCHYIVLDTIVLLDATVEFLSPDTICLNDFQGSREIPVRFSGDPPYTLAYFLDEDFGTQYIFQTDAQNDTIRDLKGNPSKLFVANFISNNHCLGRLLSPPEIHFQGTISKASILIDCLRDTAWRATISVNGDTSNNYGFSGYPATRVDNKIITDPIPVGVDLHLKIWTGTFDVCDTLEIQQSAPNCSCITAAGTIREQGDTIFVCREAAGSLPFVPNLDYVNDGDDGLFYILYTGRPDSLGTIIYQTDLPSIDWSRIASPLDPGYYYFSAAASTDKGSGFDPGDYCADVSPPAIIAVRTPPSATISGDIVACLGSEPEIMLDLTGTAPFAISYERNGTPQNIQANTPNFSFRVLATRDITLKLTGLKDNFCQGTVSGEVHITTIAQDTTDYERTVCINDTLTIGTETFSMARPSGLAKLPGAAQGGCDSIMRVLLHFTTPDTVPIRRELCPGDTLTIGGEAFYAGHLSGLVQGSAGMSCDTILDVQLKLYPGLTDTMHLDLCPGDTLTVEGQPFHAGSPSALIKLPGQSASGCDSLVYVEVIPHQPGTNVIRETLCEGDFRMYGGERFDVARPSGMILAGQDVYGCDSLLDILLTYVPIPVGVQQIALCPGEIIEIKGVFFSETHLSDTVRLAGESHLGCDSLVVVTAELLQPSTSFLTMDLCTGSEIIINGHTYNESNPTGREVFPGANARGCDSIIQIDLHFTDAVHFLLDDPICPGDFLFVDTVRFDANRSSGSVLLPGASRFGCDSIVDVALQVVHPSTHQLQLTLCPGDFLMVNGVRYDAGHPAGTETLIAGNHQGCDSIIEVSLTFDTLMIEARATTAGCQANAGKMLEITALTNGHPPYRFRINGGQELGIPSLPFDYPVPDTTTVIHLQVTDQSGCEASTVISFQDTSALAFVSLGPDREVMLGEPVTINLETNVSLVRYTVFLPDGTTCQNCLPLTMDLLKTGAFRIRAEDAQGCTYSDDVNIIVSETSRLFIPNVFSPDGDGQNDELRLYPGSNLVMIHSFVIRDVWGEIVFEAHSYYPDASQPVWDGTLKGKILNPGVFHYFVDAEFSNGNRRILNGDITLLR